MHSSVRFAEKADIPALMQLGEAYVIERGLTFAADNAEMALHGFIDSEQAEVFIAEVDDAPAGVLIVYWEDEFQLERIGHIGVLFAAPKYRGTGIGRKMARVAASWFDAMLCKTAFAAAAGKVGQDTLFINTVRKAGFAPSHFIMERGHGIS